MYKILAINPGSTSTKIAVYEDEKMTFSKSINHATEILAHFAQVADQEEMRTAVILDCLKIEGIELNTFSAIIGRGGMVPKVESGAYLVNDLMVKRLKESPMFEHASNLGAIIAFQIASEIGVPAYIYDSVRVDELNPIARISGLKEIPRTSTSHALNSRAMAMKAAKQFDKSYQDMNFVVAHLGGGISVSAHEKGRMVEIMADDEGPFSPERAGRVPCIGLVELCFSGKYDKNTIKKMLRGKGGLSSYLGTVDVREIEKSIDAGDEDAKLIYEAMAYQVAKGIGDLSTVLEGNVDCIVITGGIAHSERMTELIKKRVKFIAPVMILPGENEMEALAFGALRVLKGEEKAKSYTEA